MSATKGSSDVDITYVNTGLSGVYLQTFLYPNNTTAVQHEITRNMTALILAAATKGTKPGMNSFIIDANKRDTLLIPVLRAALPMYVVAQTAFPKADTVLVRCIKNRRMDGGNSVEVRWMGRKAFAAKSDLDGKDVLLMDTVITTGDTILTLLDEMSDTINSVGMRDMKGRRRVTVLTCYVGPQALARIKAHPLVKSIVVGALADSVGSIDGIGFVTPSTGADLGDKLFGGMAEC